MLDALKNPERWNSISWSTIVATAADDPAEVLARLAASHGDIAVDTATRAPSLGRHAARRARIAVHFARMALLLDAVRTTERDPRLVVLVDLADDEDFVVFDPALADPDPVDLFDPFENPVVADLDASLARRRRREI